MTAEWSWTHAPASCLLCETVTPTLPMGWMTQCFHFVYVPSALHKKVCGSVTDCRGLLHIYFTKIWLHSEGRDPKLEAAADFSATVRFY